MPTKRKKTDSDLLDDMEDVIEIQAAAGNWDADPYMHGMLNGMILMHAMAAGKRPEFKTAPRYWSSRSYNFAKKVGRNIRVFSARARDYTISSVTGLTIDFTQLDKPETESENVHFN